MRNRRTIFQPLFRVPRSTFRVSFGVGQGEIRLLGRSHTCATGDDRDRAGRGGGEVPRLPAARRAPARPRHASPAAAARHQDAGRTRRAARGSRRVAVRPRRPASVAARGGAPNRAGGRAGRTPTHPFPPHLFYPRPPGRPSPPPPWQTPPT